LVAGWRRPRHRGPPRSAWRRWLPIRWHSYGHRGMFCSILSFIFKTNLFTLLGGGTGDSGAAVSQPDPSRDAAEKPLVQFVSFVLDDTQKTWTQLLPQQTSTPYRHAKLVLFRDSTRSACGGAGPATGPFYCPEDEKVYIDLGSFDELNRRVRGTCPILPASVFPPNCPRVPNPRVRSSKNP